MGKFTVYRSGAGSGKTFTLVKDYLRLCLDDPKTLHFQFKRILAMTFTNKAAAEMKNRVIESLNRITKGEKTHTAALLCKELGINEGELQKRASVVLTQILHHYSDFALSTLDSFTHRLVKTFAHDLQLPVNFNVELDEESFNAEVVHDLISRTGADKEVGDLLREYVLMKSEENSAWDPEVLIMGFSKLLRRENSAAYVEKLLTLNKEQLQNSNKQIRETIRKFNTQMAVMAQKALDRIQLAGLQDEDFLYKKNGAHSVFRKAAENTLKPQDLLGSRFLEAVRQKKWFGPGYKSNTATQQIAEELSTCAQELIHYFNEHYHLFALCKLIDKQIIPLLLLKKIEEISQIKKDESRLVFIAEFNRKIFDLIQNEPTPFIYERLGERYRHFLLDEFQDTSKLQWQNLLPLIDNSLSNGWQSLLVGDGKQSIYRWRNADVKQFNQLPDLENSRENPVILEREKNLKRNFEEQVLATNYRSLKNIVEFNNTFFTNLSHALLDDEFLSIYKDCSQKALAGDGGYVSINSYKPGEEDKEEINFSFIQSHIHSALEDGFLYRDICILCRTNQQGNSVAHFLMQNAIPVVSSDSLLLNFSLDVQVLLACLNYLANPRNTISGALVLQFLHQKGLFDEEALHRNLLLLSGNTSLFEILQSYQIEISATELSRLGLADICIRFVTSLGLSNHNGIHIRFFLDEVNSFIQKENSNLQAFLFWWEKRSEKASLIIPQDSDAVKVMTIHSSKGLEFPVVILPFFNWKFIKFKEDWIEVNDNHLDLPVAVVQLNDKAAEAGYGKEVEAEKQAQILENMNLIYVAFTRAIERLHIICKDPERSVHEVNSWILSHLPEGMIHSRDGVSEFGSLNRKSHKVIESKSPQYELRELKFNKVPAQIAIRQTYLHNSSESETAKRQGILLHWVLSEIKSEQDLEKALINGENKGFYSSHETEGLRDKLKMLIQHPSLAPYFKEGLLIKTEAEILIPGGQVFRPDRIVFTEKETVIMDYKSGKEDLKKHGQQLLNYGQILSSMCYPGVRKLLVYIEDAHVIELN